MNEVQQAWDAWQAATPPATKEVQNYTNACLDWQSTLGLSKAEVQQTDVTAIWTFATPALRAWREAESTLDPKTQRTERYHAAEMVRSTMGIVRNLAISEAHTTEALRHWDDIQATLHMCLTFERMSDPILIPAIRVMAQCLTNWITGHDEAKTMLWTACVVPPASTSSLQVIHRLLSSSDERTSLAALVFLLNALIGHHERFRDLFDTEAGGQIMDVVIHMYSPSRMDDYSDVIDIILAIADGFFEAGLAGALYAKMGPLDDVTTSQITWIHILASCQHELVHKDVARPWKTTAEPLVESMLLLTEQAIAEMNKAVTKSGEVNQSILVRSYLGLLGLLDCLHASGMRGQEAVGTKTQTDTEAVALLAHMRTAGVVPACVRLLHETNLYKPPVSPFQPALAGLQPPEGHVLSSLHTTQSEHEIYADSSMPHLKRATLQLLGTLVFHPERTSTLPPHIKAVQDEVRELGGLYDVLSLTALDELNPYIREHAIFTLRYLLEKNDESQAQVRQLRPVPL